MKLAAKAAHTILCCSSRIGSGERAFLLTLRWTLPFVLPLTREHCPSRNVTRRPDAMAIQHPLVTLTFLLSPVLLFKLRPTAMVQPNTFSSNLALLLSALFIDRQT